jgi:2-dehydropantoate 2-reductase
MGGALAAEAALAGHDVYIVDVSKALVDQVTEHGLEIRSADSMVIGRPKATTDAASVGPVDVAVLFVKAQHTRSAAESVKLLRGENTVVLSLQNGWGNADTLSEVLGTDRLVFGVTYHSCSVIDLGIVNHSGRGETFVGAYEGDDQSDAETAAELLRTTGWSPTVTSIVRTEIWKKLVLNSATLPTAALTGLNAGALGETQEMASIIEGLARETTIVAQSLGLDVDPDERIERIRATLAGAGSGKPSMLQDTDARRKTEIEVINAAVVRAGESTGTPTPLNSLMTALIAGLERSWTK